MNDGYVRFCGIALLLVSFSLLLVNVVGLVQGPELYPQSVKQNPGSKFSRYKELESGSSLFRKKEEEASHYFVRLTNTVNGHLVHKWGSKVPTRVSVFDNYLLYFLSFVRDSYKNYEFRKAERALSRGYGLCSQASLILEDILDREGFNPGIWNLNGHVLVEVVDHEKKSWLLDADYGVIMPYGMTEIKANQTLVKQFYEPDHGEKAASNMASIFSSPNTFHPTRTYESGNFKTIYKERIAYILIWIIPAFGLILAWCLVRIAGRTKRT
jgi:hypothetical protein